MLAIDKNILVEELKKMYKEQMDKTVSPTEVPGYMRAMHDVFKLLDYQPLVFLSNLLRPPKWIPVSERLPDDGKYVLVTLGHTYESSYREHDYRQYSLARYLRFENGECHWCDERHGYLEWDQYSDNHGGCSLYQVLAWMPLPEVYGGTER